MGDDWERFGGEERLDCLLVRHLGIFLRTLVL